MKFTAFCCSLSIFDGGQPARNEHPVDAHSHLCQPEAACSVRKTKALDRMQIGVISDIHGNVAALDAVLTALDARGVDRMICLGDAVDPLPGSREVVERLEQLSVPILRGNHEDYVVDAFEDRNVLITPAPSWEPVRVLARSLDRALIDRLATLPFTYSYQDVPEIMFFHASPNSNVRGWIQGIDEPLAAQIIACAAPVLACGHWHLPSSRVWRDKHLHVAGSVGIPLRGKQVAECLIFVKQGREWQAEHLEVPYDATPTLERYQSTGWLAEGGPSAWMMHEEIRTATRFMIPFNQWLKDTAMDVSTMATLKDAGRAFLIEMGTWSQIAPFT